MKNEPKRNLERTLQALSDSGIAATITMLWDGGIDFGLIPFTDVGTDKEAWDNVRTFDELADGLHFAAVKLFPRSIYFEKATPTVKPAPHNLEKTMQALYDSEISFTVTHRGNANIDFALVSYMEYADLKPEDWHHVETYAQLAEALHKTALDEYPMSDYAKQGEIVTTKSD
jgi:hypothetical protein